MMTHDEALQLLSARVDGELTPEQERALEAWLAEHPDGRVIAEAFACQHVELRNAFEPRRTAALRTAQLVSAQLPAPVMPAAPLQPHPRRRQLWSILPPIAAAVCIALLISY